MTDQPDEPQSVDEPREPIVVPPIEDERPPVDELPPLDMRPGTQTFKNVQRANRVIG